MREWTKIAIMLQIEVTAGIILAYLFATPDPTRWTAANKWVILLFIPIWGFFMGLSILFDKTVMEPLEEFLDNTRI